MIKEILAYIFETELEVTSKIDEINESKGYPNAGADTYCSYELNNTKWIVKLSPNIGMEDVFYPKVAEDFDYKE
jgi:hypothetical protein